MTNTDTREDELRRVPDWQWLAEILSEFDITETRFNRKNAHDFTSLEARIYRDIQKRYKPRKKPDYIVTASGSRTSKQYEDAKRIHADQINTMHEMGYGLMLDGFTFYKYGHELEPYDFETNFNMHQAYEIHQYATTLAERKAREDNLAMLTWLMDERSERMYQDSGDKAPLKNGKWQCDTATMAVSTIKIETVRRELIDTLKEKN